MERRDFLVGAAAVTTLIATSTKVNATELSAVDSDIKSFIQLNPELEDDVIKSLRRDGIHKTREFIKAYNDFSRLVNSSPSALYDYNNILPQWVKCVDVPKSAVVAVGWYYKVTGGALNLAAIPVAGTVAGVPIAVILAALGIVSGWGGDAILSWADRQRWPKRVCVSVN